MKILAHTLKPYLGLGCAAVPFNVSKALLHDPKQAERGVSGNSEWNVLVIELDLNFLLIGKLLAEGFYTCNKSKTLKRG
jgi:hypothetical protein